MNFLGENAEEIAKRAAARQNWPKKYEAGRDKNASKTKHEFLSTVKPT